MILRRFLFAACLLTTSANAAKLRAQHRKLQRLGAPKEDESRVFVAVTTTRSTSVEKRNAVRSMWKEVDAGSGSVCFRFAVCSGNDQNSKGLEAENHEYGDLLFLNCQEGYAQGLLTRKTLSIMKVFRHGRDECLNRPLLMKVDDDTFVAGHRFHSTLSEAVSEYGSSFLYAGVPDHPAHVIRDKESEWYEPEENYPEEMYPQGMYGGPGYILGRKLVEKLVDDDVANSKILWNEDRAVSVWVNTCQQRGTGVDWFNISGTNGFEWDDPVETGTWGDYPYVLHHHLDEACISCMVKLDSSNKPDTKVDDCLLHNSKRQATDRKNGAESDDNRWATALNVLRRDKLESDDSNEWDKEAGLLRSDTSLKSKSSAVTTFRSDQSRRDADSKWDKEMRLVRSDSSSDSERSTESAIKVFQSKSSADSEWENALSLLRPHSSLDRSPSASREFLVDHSKSDAQNEWDKEMIYFRSHS